MTRRILITINAKPRTCGPCEWWHMRSEGHHDFAPWCPVFRRWLETNRHHKYRCDECLEAEREAG